MWILLTILTSLIALYFMWSNRRKDEKIEELSVIVAALTNYIEHKQEESDVLKGRNRRDDL